MPNRLQAYFLTWTTHATWLHGDERGSVDRRHNRPSTPTLAPDPARESRAATLADSPFILSPEARAVVDATIRDHCAHRGWRLLALNVRTNHVHVVFDCDAQCSPEKAMSELKAWSTRRLRESGFLSKDARAWTEHGSTRWINTPQGLLAAIDYVKNHQ